MRSAKFGGLLMAFCFVVLFRSTFADDAESELAGEISAARKAVIAAFTKGDPAALSEVFLADGEWISEFGVVYQGRSDIAAMFTEFFEKHHGGKMDLKVDSLRQVGPVVIEEGERQISGSKEGGKSSQRYMALWTKESGQWKVASVRDFPSDDEPTPHDFVAPLAWLVGDWVNEGTDAVVKIHYEWSEDGNFLLGNFVVTREGQAVLKTTQRIGWDPVQQNIRSWVFDSDGGFAGGKWLQVEDGWVVKSEAVLPEGVTGSATITMTPVNEDRFTIVGTDRIAGNAREGDFSVTVVRQHSNAPTSK